MWQFLQPINLIRYLIVLRTNIPLVRLPGCLPVELSLVLGNAITERLPTQARRPWRKALAVWEAYGGLEVVGKKKPSKPVPEAQWPVQTTFFVYPGKYDYGKDELLFLELKLMGESADHALFLEIILPALESLGYDRQAKWSGKTTLWGHFDIHAVYVARGPQWRPLVQDGKLDLDFRATPKQWAHRLKFSYDETYSRLTWLTPFDFSPPGTAPKSSKKRKNAPAAEVPTLRDILESLTERISQLLPGKYNTPQDAWQAIAPEWQFNLLDALAQAEETRLRRWKLKPAPKEWPGRWIGEQRFDPIPLAVLPFLELASILHVGRGTHFGAGTFRLDQ